MSQRISITYTIDIEELQQEVSRLWRKVYNKISELRPDDISEEDVLEYKTATTIEKMQQQIVDINHCLADIGSIVLSYNLHRGEEMLSQVADVPESELQGLSEIQQKLEHFKNSVSADEVPT